MTKSVRSFLMSGQRSGHQRSPKVKYCRFQHFFPTNRHITREPEELQRPVKAHSIALLTLCRQHLLIFDLRSMNWPLESKSSKNNRFFAKKFFFSVITFDSVNSRHSFCQHRISLIETRRINYNLTLKGHLENLTSGQGWQGSTDRKRSYCISVDPYGRSEHIYGAFIALNGLYQKLLPKKLLVAFHDQKWPWQHSEGSLVAIFRLRVSSLLVTWCLSVSNVSPIDL